MQREAIYDAWVPVGGDWSLWARPVLFGQMSDSRGDAPEQPWLNLPTDWAPPAAENALLILDLPEKEAVHLGLALAGRGYRPVPLYSGCTGPSEVIDQSQIIRALQAGAEYLARLSLPPEAPPVFLLDSLRGILPCPLRPGMLDNRWRVFPEDFPSEQLLRQRGVSRVVLVRHGRQQPADDLARVLRSWQEAGLTLEVKDLAEAGLPHRLVVPPIPWYRRWWDGLLQLLGVQRRPRDGFGYIVPEPSHG
jgi:hypothetical protein